jgi:WD40 repeat protein
MADVFISYSRKDKDFVQNLHEALKASNRDTWVDWSDIPPTAVFMQEIYAGIEAADTFLFVLSPDSVKSEVCGMEIDHAVKYQKRLVPIVRRDVDAKAVHPALAAHNWIFFRESDNFYSAFTVLMKAIDTDLAHAREHTRLLLRALEWDRHERERSYLLTGLQIDVAERWLTEAGDKKPEPTPLHRDYVAESRRADDAIQARTALLERRRRQFQQAAMVLGVIGFLAVAATIVAVTQAANTGNQAATATVAQGQAINSLNTSVAGAASANTQVAVAGQTLTPLVRAIKQGETRSESLRLAALADDQLNQNNNPVLASLLAIRALKTTYTTQADAALVRALDRNFAYMMLAGDAQSVAYSPDGRFIVTASRDNTAIIWDAAAGEPVRSLAGHTDAVWSAAYSPDGRFIVTASRDNTAIIWDAAAGEPVRSLAGHTDAVWSAAYSPDGRFIVTASRDKTVIIWDAATGERVRRLAGRAGGVSSAAYSPDGRFVVTASGDNTAIIWEAATGKQLRTLAGYSAAYSPDGHFVVTASEGTAIIWDATGAQARSLAGHTSWVTSAAYSPDGRFIFTASTDRTLIWDVTTGQQVRVLAGVRSGAAYSPNGRFIISPNDNMATIWDVATGQQVRVLAGPIRSPRFIFPVTSVSYSPDGRFIVTGSGGDDTTIWDATSGQQVQTLAGSTGDVSYSPDGRFIVTASSNMTAIIWDIASGEQVRTLKGHTNHVTSAAYSPDGCFIVTTSRDGTAIIWAVATGKPVQVLSGHTSFVNSAAYSPDGRFIVTTGSDRTGIIWDATTGQKVRTLVGHTDVVNSAVYSPDGHFIVTASNDGTARLWDADYRDFIAYACGRMANLGDFTDYERRGDFAASERQGFGITDTEPTCPQFANADRLLTISIPTTTPLPITLPVWTPIASPTASPTPTPAP